MMNTKIWACVIIIIFICIMGCAGGDYAKIKTQSADESKVTQQHLIENWSNYTIWLRSTVVVFDPKNDNREILVGSRWGTVNDQQTWDQIVNANTTAQGTISPMWADYRMTRFREIRSPDNQKLFGYVIHQQRDLVSARVVDEDTVRLFYNRARFGGP